MKEKIKDGGPAFKCIFCGITFSPNPAQIRFYDHRCLPCKRVQQNALNRSRPEVMKEKAKQNYLRNKKTYKKYFENQKSNPLYLLKRKARRKVSTEIEAGRLKREPCEKCGNLKTDAHHHDYSKSLEIRWLCRQCHITEEKSYANKRSI